MRTSMHVSIYRAMLSVFRSVLLRLNGLYLATFPSDRLSDPTIFEILKQICDVASIKESEYRRCSGKERSPTLI